MNLVPQTFSWESQVVQYPALGRPGISYVCGVISDDLRVDCLLYRDKHGKIRGILNHFPIDCVLERAGNILVIVDPRFRRKKIATKLLREAQSRWVVNFDQQSYTADGASLAEHFKATQ
jgi:ribosomal protein S18 acetylase RimI-like enzyme